MNNKLEAWQTLDWTCPFCNRDATITGHNVASGSNMFELTNSEGLRRLFTTFVVCPNPKCKKFTLTAWMYEGVRVPPHNEWRESKLLNKWSLIPRSRAQSFPDYIPKAVLADYNEACLICELSPKASATLSRRCLQGMIRDFWKVKKPRLVDEIAAIKDKVEQLTWQAIEAVRKVGNIGAHMEADINVIVDVDPQEAELLIGLIESLLKDWYVAAENRKAHLNALVQLAADKDKEKKQSPKVKSATN